MKTFVLGGARSGKSSLAARWAMERSQTGVLHRDGRTAADGSDPEMQARIAKHRQQRPAHWRVREEPLHLGAAIREESAGDEGTLLLVDCLTLWAPTACGRRRGASRAGHCRLAARKRGSSTGHCAPAAARSSWSATKSVRESCRRAPRRELFRDEQGWINQAVAAECDAAFLVVAGLPLQLKPAS